MYLFPHHVLPLVEPGTLMNVYLASVSNSILKLTCTESITMPSFANH